VLIVRRVDRILVLRVCELRIEDSKHQIYLIHLLRNQKYSFVEIEIYLFQLLKMNLFL